MWDTFQGHIVPEELQHLFSLLSLMLVWRARKQGHTWEPRVFWIPPLDFLLCLISVFHAVVKAAPRTRENILTETLAMPTFRNRQQVQLSGSSK